ncbi:transposase [Lewinella sp. IMCC34191]|uniref:transposase n=1 Tax=Lewinella sp. IMCC34191 TaxID=2259172 RepID=UPI000E23F56C|nr:transposase [Lewinella sp. IMCC34191]
MITDAQFPQAEALPEVFHLYNRANDRRTLFTSHQNYLYFINKVRSNFAAAADILGYCVMPNHFHLLITPHHPLDVVLKRDGKVMKRLPTNAISEAVRRTLMGFSQGYNRTIGFTGSRFQQRTRCKHHLLPFHYGLRYVHYNPVKANLVKHPGEWPYSSYNEYAGHVDSADRLCNIELGRKLLQMDILD